jgi:hypothetical protein
VQTVENLLRLAEIEASLAQGLLPLGAVKGDSSVLFYVTWPPVRIE